MESRQAQLTLAYPRGINKNKGSLFKGILPTHILLVETTYVDNQTIFPSHYLSPTILITILFLFVLLHLSFKMLSSAVFKYSVFSSPLWHHTYQQITGKKELKLIGFMLCLTFFWY